MLAPHHAEDRELQVVRVAAETGADRRELHVGDAEALVQRHVVRGGHGNGHRAPTSTGRAAARRSPALSTNERISSRPSSEPRMASTAVSGCGMSPATLPAAFVTPAMARSEPFGLAGSSSPPAVLPSACA